MELSPRLTCLFWFSGSLHISFKLSPIHSFTSSNHCLAGLLRDIFLSTCKMMFARVPFVVTACPNYLSLNDFQRWLQVQHDKPFEQIFRTNFLNNKVASCHRRLLDTVFVLLNVRFFSFQSRELCFDQRSTTVQAALPGAVQDKR